MIGTTITHYRIIETLGEIPIRPANVNSASRHRIGDPAALRREKSQ